MKSFRAITFTCFLLALLLQHGLTFAAEPAQHSYKPKEGYVPDKETAIKIALAIWVPIYGKQKIESEKPYSAILKKDIWYVSGSLSRGLVGGVAEAEISKDDGRIIRISHGK